MESQKPCVFCEIVIGRAPAYVVAESEHAICILDIHPYTQGHCLVVTRRHVQWWHEMTAEETNDLFNLARTVARRMMKKLEPDFVFLYARGRRIPHTHIFLIPTFSGDVLDRFFNALENFQESPQKLAELKKPEAMQVAMTLLREDT